MQLLFIAMVWWTSIAARPEQAGRLSTRRPVVKYEHADRESKVL
jgi:hypothetical protein